MAPEQARKKRLLKLDWEVAGNTGQTVCLLHPLGMERSFWDQLVSQLSVDRRCLLIDLPGHGRSPLPSGSYSITDISDALTVPLSAIGDGPVDVVGASMGGMVALALADRHPRLVVRLVLADSTARYSEPLRAMWTERASAARSAGMAPLVDGLLDVWFSPAARESGGSAVDYVRNQLLAINPEAYALACEALAEADLRRVGPNIGVPALVVAGDNDVLADDSRRLAETIPSASLVWLPSGRHGAPLELADQFTSIVRNWLD